MDGWAHLADFRALLGCFFDVFYGGVIHCYTVSCVDYMLLCLTRNCK